MNTVYLIGPREPSGLSWLYNCFLCLGIKVHYVNPRNGGQMWQLDGDRYILNPVDDLQKKWAPVLSSKSHFNFRTDIQVQFDHIWPTGWQRGQKIIFFVRNPYESLLSRWRRDANKISFAEFLKVPDHTTLLDKVDNWNLFCEAWLQQRHRVDWHLVKFEDYRSDAEKTLREVIEFLGIAFSNEEVVAALAQSGFEAAKRAEDEYQPSTPKWLQVCDDVFHAYGNRKVNSGKKSQLDLDHTVQEREYILKRTAYVCREFGYAVGSVPMELSYLPQKAMLSFYRHLDLGDDWIDDISTFNMANYINDISILFENIRDVDVLFRTASGAGLIFGEVAALISALQEMQGNYLNHFQQQTSKVAKSSSLSPDKSGLLGLRGRFFGAVARAFRVVS